MIRRCFGFTANGGLSSPFNLTDGASQVFTGVTPGNYAIAETIPSGWGLSIGCVGGTSSTVGNTANLTLAAGDQVTCVFTNTKLATVTIEKVTDPAPDPSLTTFSFTAIGGLSPANFNLQNGDTQSFSGVSPGTYEVTETVPSGWSLTSSCDNGSAIDNILVNAGDDITCVFTNTAAPGTIIIEKVTSPAGDPTEFTFNPGGGLTPSSSFTLTDGMSQTFSNVTIGSGYSVTETVPSGWSLTSSCDNGSAVDNISVNAGQTITCVFTNSKDFTYLPLILKNFTPPPDLFVDNVVVSNLSPDTGDPVVIDVTLRNTGPALPLRSGWISTCLPRQLPRPLTKLGKTLMVTAIRMMTMTWYL